MADRSESPYLSVVMPVYNEERNISESLRRVEVFMAATGWTWELLVSDDGSTDQTAALVQAASSARNRERLRLITAPENRGKGAAARKGILAATGKYILLTDADLSSPIKEVCKLIGALDGGFEVAIGSRALPAPGGDVQQSFRRRLSGRIFNLLVRFIALGGFKDTQCGFKCFRKEAAHKLFSQMTLEGFTFDVELLMLAKRNGIAVKEVPVMWRQGEQSRVRFWRDSLAMMKDLFWLRKRYSRQ